MLSGMPVLRRWAKPKPNPPWPWNADPRTCQLVLPGAEGIGALAVATAAAMPRRASVRLAPTCDCRAARLPCSDATLPWRPAMSGALKFDAARLPAASVVTNLVGPVCAAVLAAEVMPARV